jgi:hypothetical protein
MDFRNAKRCRRCPTSRATVAAGTDRSDPTGTASRASCDQGSAQAGEDTRTRVASLIGSIVDMRFTKSDAASAHYTSVDPQR